MNCIHCGKRYKDPLELYNGKLICPNCGHALIPSFSVTRENEELFGLSEQFFYGYLTKASRAAAGGEGSAHADKDEKKRQDKLLRQAIEYCRRAAYSGHPEALVRLGYYYDNNYVDYGRSDSDRDKIAYKYYARVLYEEEQDGAGGDGRNTPVERRLCAAWGKGAEKNAQIVKRVHRIRRRAAIALLSMLSMTSEELARQEKYDLKTHLDRLIAANVIHEGELSFRRGELPQADRVDKIFKLLLSFGRQSERSPFFGYYILSGAEMYRLSRRLGGLSPREKEACKLLVQGVPVLYEEGKAILDLSQLYTLARKTNTIAPADSVPEDLPAGGKYCVFFFNGNCDGVYARKSMIEEFIEKYDVLGEGDFSLLINADVRTYGDSQSDVQIAEHIFYADDLYYVKKFADKRDVEEDVEQHILTKLMQK